MPGPPVWRGTVLEENSADFVGLADQVRESDNDAIVSDRI
jgi:hypothetical protein